MHEKIHGNRAFYVEILLLILFLILSLTVLLRTYGLARGTASRAEALSIATRLSQDAAERFSASQSDAALAALWPESTAGENTLTAYFTAGGDAAAAPAQGGFVVTVTLSSEPREVGEMRFAQIDVTHGGESFAQLTVQKYMAQ